MNLYLIQQTVNQNYDTYDSAVVVAESAEEARNMHPAGYCHDQENMRTWARPEDVSVKCIGTAAAGVEAGPVCASFNAG